MEPGGGGTSCCSPYAESQRGVWEVPGVEDGVQGLCRGVGVRPSEAYASTND